MNTTTTSSTSSTFPFSALSCLTTEADGPACFREENGGELPERPIYPYMNIRNRVSLVKLGCCHMVC